MCARSILSASLGSFIFFNKSKLGSHFTSLSVLLFLIQMEIIGGLKPPLSPSPPFRRPWCKKIIYCKINYKLYSAKTFFDQLFILGCFAKEFQSKYCMPSPECGMYSWAGCLEVRWQFLTVVKILKYIEVFSVYQFSGSHPKFYIFIAVEKSLSVGYCYLTIVQPTQG